MHPISPLEIEVLQHVFESVFYFILLNTLYMTVYNIDSHYKYILVISSYLKAEGFYEQFRHFDSGKVF